MSVNALQELYVELDNYGPMKCADLVYSPDYDYSVYIKLKVNHTPIELESFKQQMSTIDYDPGYGRQYLRGTIWLMNGTWLERGEYDGSEWWRHLECPSIPEELR